MLDKIKIAKSLVRIARRLMAGYDTYDEDKAYYNENIKDMARLEGFSLSFEDDDIVFTYGKDETGSCNIVFGEIEGGDWGYTVYAGGEEVASVVEEHPKEAYDRLLANVNKYVRKMDAALEKVEEAVDEPLSSMGECLVTEVQDNGEFSGKGNLFRHMLSDGGATYQAVFKPSAGVDAKEVMDSLKNIKSDIGMGLPVSMRRGENIIKFQLVNKGDLDFAKGVISGYGWTLA